MHPLIEEFCRIPSLQACRPEFFRRMQRELREQIQPLLDDRDTLLHRYDKAERLRLLAEADLAALRELHAKKITPKAKAPATSDEVTV